MNVPFIGFLMCCAGAAVCTAKGDWFGTLILLLAASACRGIEHSRTAKERAEATRQEGAE